MRLGDFMDEMAVSFMTITPLIFMNGDVPIKGSNQFLKWF